MSFADELQRFGLLLPKGRPTVVLAGTAEEIDRLYPTVDAALRQRAEYRLVLAAAGGVDGLRKRYPHEIVLPVPHSVFMQHWQRRLDAVLLIGPTWLARSGPAGFLDNSQLTTSSMLATMLPPPLALSRKSSFTGTFLIDLFGGRRIASLDGLAERLEKPRTIICLGNGPSSEDQRLADFGDAALFRVNWNWRGRGWMTGPGVVFTADPDLPGPEARPVIVFPTAAVGRPILSRHIRAMRPPSAGYAFLDEFDPSLTDLSGPMIPTNGALMIAIAAALKPERIVVAGMDLYQHPDGRYPGDAEALGGYSREHSAEIDLDLIRTALRGFAGETIILSDNLREALAAC
ncbi:hypothetical protein [Mesorhizobium shangrilense]|uniref:DUF115 domain-containing protein n=1 Tax=Mesorhizobium shangrilense TaxID=460060 RepID=A0ABV2DPW4_9HYPH